MARSFLGPVLSSQITMATKPLFSFHISQSRRSQQHHKLSRHTCLFFFNDHAHGQKQKSKMKRNLHVIGTVPFHKTEKQLRQV